MPVALVVEVSAPLAALLERSGLTLRGLDGDHGGPARHEDAAAPVDVLVVGPRLRNPVATAQRLHARSPDAAVILLPQAADQDAVVRALATAPFLGPDPRCLLPDRTVEEVAEEVRRAAEGAVRRRRYRDAVEAMSVKLASAPIVAAQPLAFLDRIFDLAPVGILGLDDARTVVIANPRAQEILGAAVEPRLGTRLQDLLDGEAYATIDELLSRTAQGGAGSPVRATLTRSTARGERLLEVLASPVAQVGERRVFLAIVEDVTERETAERERTALIERLDEAVRTRDEFLSVASHELKTPLTALKLQLALLGRSLPGGDVGERAAGRVAGALRQADALNALVERLLDVSRIAVGKLTLDARELDLAELVRDVGERMRGVLSQAGSELNLEVAGPVIGRWDASRLEQVIVNLLSNAAKYGASSPVTLSLRCEHGRAKLSVTDHGIGMEPAEVPNLFGRFSRGVSERHYGGLGLGLYITRQIVVASGGAIQVRTAPGKGAVFEVSLPLTPP